MYLPESIKSELLKHVFVDSIPSSDSIRFNTNSRRLIEALHKYILCTLYRSGRLRKVTRFDLGPFKGCFFSTINVEYYTAPTTLEFHLLGKVTIRFSHIKLEVGPDFGGFEDELGNLPVPHKLVPNVLFNKRPPIGIPDCIYTKSDFVTSPIYAVPNFNSEAYTRPSWKYEK